MKFLFDFFPIILFFIAFKLKNIFFATGIAIVASIVQIGYLLIRKKKIDYQMWVSLVLILVFGGLTIILHDEWFIKWKPSILYWVFALVIIIAGFLYKKNIIKLMLHKQVQLPERVWRNLNISWCLFFLILGFVNLYVAYNFSTSIWVDFKLFGCMGLIFIFVVVQGFYMMPYMDKDASSKTSYRNKKK